MPKICLMCGDTFPDTTTFCPKDGSALRAAVQGDDLIGELIAERYLITDLLSHGGMGSVYVASDVRLPQQFAVKVLKQSGTPDPSLISRFRQEAESVCRINHDRVARVFDFGFMPDDRAYIIMEYVAGRTLKQLLETRGILDAREAAKIIGMAAEGIDAAHRLGIVHRDLKPENIMILDDPGGGLRVKVLDFGIAKLQDAKTDEGYTKPGFVIGTPAWMSPEQLMADTLDARSDIYSLGLVAFALITGEHAFTGESEQSEMLARITVPPRTLAAAAPQIAWPAALQALFDRTLSRDIKERPSTAVLFATEMLEIVAQWKPVSAGHAAVTPPRATPATTAASPEANRAGSRRMLVMSAIGVTVVGASVLTYVLTRGEGSGDATGVIAAPAITSPTTGDSLRVAVPSTTVPPPINATPVDTANARRPDARDVSAAPPATNVKPEGQKATPPVTATGSPKQPVAPASAQPTSVPPASSSSAKRNAELARIMKAFDSDELSATQTIAQIEALSGKLGPLDQAWAQIYFGNAYYQLGNKPKACAAFVRASALAGESTVVRTDSEEKRLMIGCPP